jgi:hypothetical protein
MYKKEERKRAKNVTLLLKVKDTVVHGHIPKRTRIPTNEIGDITHLKGVWQQAVKDAAY